MKKRKISAIIFTISFGIAFAGSFCGYALGVGAADTDDYSNNIDNDNNDGNDVQQTENTYVNAMNDTQPQDDETAVPDDVTWTYENGTLILTGTGRMDNFELGATPWAQYNSDIHYISVGDGITYIGANAFVETAVTVASLPSSITEIGDNAFAKKDDGTGNVVLYVTQGSYCQAYAEINGFSYQVSAAIADVPTEGETDPNAIGDETAEETNTAAVAETDADGNIVIVPYAGAADNGDMPKGIVVESGESDENKDEDESASNESGTSESESATEYVTGATREYESMMGKNYNDTGINWSVRNNKLIISGAGKMDNYTDYKQAPWSERYSATNAVAIEDNVTSIGSHAFAQNKNLKSVKIPSTVYSIGNNAFYNCPNLKQVDVPSNVLSIGKHALGYKFNSKTKKAEKIAGFTIAGEKGSAAENYAKVNKFKFTDKIIANGPIKGASSAKEAFTPSLKIKFAICLFASLIFAAIITFIYYVWQRNGGLNALLKKQRAKEKRSNKNLIL